MTEIIYELCGSTKMQKVVQEAYQENGKTETAYYYYNVLKQ